MSHLKSRVGSWTLIWESTPKGLKGTARVQVQGQEWVLVHWWRDLDGIQILLPHGAYGYDFVREPDEQGQFQYAVLQRQVHHEWARVPVSYGDEVVLPVNRGTKTKLSRIKAQMPGKIVRLLVQEGQKVEKDQPLLVMEAMKMENQIRAPQAGQVTHVKVSEGQAVETGSELILLDPSVD